MVVQTGQRARHPRPLEVHGLLTGRGTPARRPGRDHPLTARIPASSGNHICLLAKVWHPLDNVAAGGLADPVNDRHWAQHNLAVLPAAPAAPEPFTFLATNPTDDEADYQISVRPMPQELWANIPNDERLRPVTASAWLSLKDTTTGGEAQAQNELTHTLTLAPGEQRPLELLLVVTDDLGNESFAPFQIAQYRNERPTGGIAVIVRGA